MQRSGRHFVINPCTTKLISIFSIRDFALVALFKNKIECKRVKYDHEKDFFYLKFIDIIYRTLQYYCEYK